MFNDELETLQDAYAIDEEFNHRCEKCGLVLVGDWERELCLCQKCYDLIGTDDEEYPGAFDEEDLP